MNTRVKFIENQASDCWIISNKYSEYEKQDELEKAVQALNLKLTLHKHTRGLINPEASVILNNIATINNRLGNLEYSTICGFAGLSMTPK